ncbi:MAG: TetR family transcriptional regulator, partial [Micrococcus sp.]|nr:TetR family transcriptional regulator [Micrococcus sp.]
MANITRDRILRGALDLLRSGMTVSLESAAERAGLTKPGLMYHFPTKEALMVGLLDHVIDTWEAAFTQAIGGSGENTTAVTRIRAYVEFTLTADFDESDMVILSDPRLREPLSRRWEERMAPWLALPTDLPDPTYGRVLAARLLADGAWFAGATGILAPGPAERARVLAVARELLD